MEKIFLVFGRLLFLIFIIISLLKSAYSDVIINEIMYNPKCESDYCEWVELYNNESDEIDLSDYKIDNNNFDDVNISGYGYIVVTRNLEKFVEYYGNFSVVDGSFSLSNNGDTINLSSDNYTYSVSYEDIAREDYSLEFFDGSWYESLYENGTMGRNNSIYGVIGENYSFLKINEFLADPFGNDSDAMPNGEWIELYNEGDSDLNLLGMRFYDNASHEIIISDVTTMGGTVIKAKGFLAIYMNGFYGFLNNDGLERIKLYDVGGNLIDEVNYGGSREGVSWSKYNGIWQMSEPSPGSDNINNKSVMGSSLEIENVYDVGSDEEAKWGDILRVRLKINKGDETKNSVSVWVEKDGIRVSKESKGNVEGKFMDYVLTLPVQLDANLDRKYSDGVYYIMAEGLNKEDKEKIKIQSEDVKGIIYKLDTPLDVESGNEFFVDVNLTNNDEEKDFEIWSYVYKGSKSYSGDREANLEKIRVGKGETVNLKLKNKVYDAEEGEYKLKIKVKEGNKKTAKEFTKSIQILENAEETEVSENNIKSTNLVGNVIYESKEEKSKRNAIYFFCLVLILTLICLVKNDSKSGN